VLSGNGIELPAAGLYGDAYANAQWTLVR